MTSPRAECAGQLSLAPILATTECEAHRGPDVESKAIELFGVLFGETQMLLHVNETVFGYDYNGDGVYPNWIWRPGFATKQNTSNEDDLTGDRSNI